MRFYFGSVVRVSSFVIVLGMLVLFPPAPTYACSICRCGDATFNALGKDGFHAQGLHLALDWERFDKDEGDPAAEAESQVEHRFTALASYGFTDAFTLFARVPYSTRKLTAVAPGAESEETKTHGFSDPEVYGQIQLWASPFSGGLGRRSSFTLNAGVKLPWGRNHVETDGIRADEHAQPGTGSTDVFGSLALLHLIDKESAVFASAGYRQTGTNDFGYLYGRTFIANVAYEHKLGSTFDGVVELNFRHAGQDRLDADGTLGDDTGGSLLYVTPRLLAQLQDSLVLRAAAQIPVVRSLNGVQEERAVVNVGLTYLFKH
jgi:hypothetical protein